MTAFIILAIVMLFMRFGPDIEFKHLLNQHFAERPAAFLEGRKRHDWLFMLIVIPVFVLGGEMVLLLGPEFMLAYAADLALYMDVVMAGAATSAATRLRGAMAQARRGLGLVKRGVAHAFTGAGRAKRSPRKPEADTARNDNDPEDGPAGHIRLAFAA